MPGSYVQCSVCKHREPVIDHDWDGAWTRCLVHEHSHNGKTDRSADPIAGRVAPSSILPGVVRESIDAIRRLEVNKWRHYQVVAKDIAARLEAALADPPVPSGPSMEEYDQACANIVNWLRGMGYDDAADALCELHVEDRALRGLKALVTVPRKADPPVGDVERRASELFPKVREYLRHRNGCEILRWPSNHRMHCKKWTGFHENMFLSESEPCTCGYETARCDCGLSEIQDHLAALGDVERPVGRLGTKDEKTP